MDELNDNTQDMPVRGPVCDDELVEFDVPTDFGPLPAPATADSADSASTTTPLPRTSPSPSRYAAGPAWPPWSAWSVAVSPRHTSRGRSAPARLSTGHSAR